MRPYLASNAHPLTEQPDVGDIRAEGRPSRVGRVRPGRGYCRPAAKAAARRYHARGARREGRALCREDAS